MELPKLQPINTIKKKKILLLSDDFRLPSGIGTISKEIIFNTVKHYDWVQLGAGVNHPEHGKGLDMSKQVAEITGVADADVKLIPWTGYGDRNILMTLLNAERPDAIFHFTDPRYWDWLYQLEHEIKTTYGIPLIYYSIWDDLPYPMWNAPFYGSCDLIMGISKQSDNIHREVLKQSGFNVYDYDYGHESKPEGQHIITGYVPHGLNQHIFKPIPKTDSSYKQMYENVKTKNGVDFLVMWNNRNIHRKHPSDLILAFKYFRNMLPKEKQDTVGLLLHTTPVDANGTDLRVVAKTIAPECKILFSEQKLAPEDLNAMYNVADVVVNIASNEGWGLSNTEAMLAGRPTIVNVTGGLQDQCGFVDKDGNAIQFDTDFTSNHTARYKTHGSWTKPIFPSNRSLQGSPTTPYIFDDRVAFEDVASAIYGWYSTDLEIRSACGSEGRKFCLDNGLTAEAMGSKMVEMIDFLFESGATQRPRYTVNKVTQPEYENLGIIL
jgi:glycosyltransferase involved in cell wall biosynthesis